MLTRLFLLSFFALLFSFVQAQDVSYTNTINVLNEKDPSVKRKVHDVDVIWFRDNYKIDLYIRNKGKAELRSARIETFDMYDKAQYTWESKNKLAIQLINTSTGKKFPFKVWADKNGTGLEVEEEQISKL